MNRLERLCAEFGQSPWLDNLSRDALASGSVTQAISAGVRGMTSNPTIFEKALSSEAYADQLRGLAESGVSLDDIYWALVADDIAAAADAFDDVYRASDGGDGFVSVEVDPRLAHDTDATVAAGRALHRTLNRPNVLIKVPATAAGVPAVEELLAAGIGVNVTLIFGLPRYREVMAAWRGGVGRAHAAGLPIPPSVASFFVSRVDTEVDRRLDVIGTPEALALRGRAAVAQAKVAYQLFLNDVAGCEPGATLGQGSWQRPLWASTSTKNPAYDDLLYVDSLIGPYTVNTLPDATLAAFADHGTPARTVDVDVEGAHATLADLAQVGIDLDDVSSELERQGVASFAASHAAVLETVGNRLGVLARS
ncbi:MAG TPA: transaldolase [Acidimicrobiales bacterium]|nr:transaldolase [Acidimicrobiales bacterium]